MPSVTHCNSFPIDAALKIKFANNKKLSRSLGGHTCGEWPGVGVHGNKAEQPFGGRGGRSATSSLGISNSVNRYMQ